jgi:hypothetical protein
MTVDVGIAATGVEAVNLLLNRIDSGSSLPQQRRSLRPRLVVSESTIGRLARQDGGSLAPDHAVLGDHGRDVAGSRSEISRL